MMAVLWLALASGGCATTAPKVERYVAPPLGSTFTFSQNNTGSFGSGTEQRTWTVAERMWEGKRMTAIGIPRGLALSNADGTQSAILGPDDKPILSFDPPTGYDYPLVVGKTSTKSSRMTVHATKQTIPFDYTYKVESYEDVTVPGGTFKTFKISSSDTTGNENVHWFSPELGISVKQVINRTAKNPSGPGTREIELISHTIAK